MVTMSRTAVVAGALTTALAFAGPAAAAEPPPVNGHTDNWVNEGTPSVEYDNGYKVDSKSEVKAALEQCNDRSVSCAATPVETPTEVVKWFDVVNDSISGKPGPIGNCGPGQGDMVLTYGGSQTFTWGWNVGASVDVSLVKDKLGVGAKAEYSESNAVTNTGQVTLTIKPGERGMLKMGHDMERSVSDVTIQGGKFGGAKITGLRTEAPLKRDPRVGKDVNTCDAPLLNPDY